MLYFYSHTYYNYLNLNEKPITKSGAPAILFLFALAFIVNSCKKDVAVSQTTPLSQKQQIGVVNEAKTWFQGNEAINKAPVAINDAGGTRNWYDGLNPGWDSTLVYQKDKGTVIETPLLNSAVSFLINTTDGSKASLQTNYTKTTYLIQKDSVGVFKTWFMVLIADTTYINGDFNKLAKNTYQQRDPAYSGRLMYFDINGRFAGGWRYQNGAITKTLSLFNAATSSSGPQINSEKPKGNSSVTCTTKSVTTVTWACVTGGNYGDPKTASVRTNDTECTPYITTKSVEECTYGGGGGSNNTPPGGNGNPNFPAPIDQGCKSLAPASVGGKQVNLQPLVPTNPDDPCLVKPVDCAGVSGGSAYLATCGCIGGTTGVPICPPNIKNNVKDPCLKKMVDATINANVNTQVNSLIQGIFGESTTINLTFVDVTNLNNTNDGFSPFNGNIVNNIMNAEVQLNANTLPHYSQEYIARVIMHESLHTYLDAKNMLSEYQHEAMMVTYVSQMANSLRQMFPSISMPDAQSLALGGLQATPTFKNSIAKDLGLLGSFEATNLAYSIGIKGTRCN